MDVYLIVYLAFRLMPFLVAAILSIAPLFNHNVRGLVYLFGMLLTVAATSFISYIVSQFAPNILSASPITPSAACNAFSLSSDGTKTLVPLELAILGYSAFYLIYSMAVNGLVQNNIATILFFISAIIGTTYWIYTNSCYTLPACIVAVVVSGGFGTLWGYIVKKEMPTRQYLFTPSNRQACYRKDDYTFVCEDTDANGIVVPSK